MVSSGRSTPLAREKGAQMHAEPDSAAVAASCSIWPQPGSSLQMVDSGAKIPPHNVFESAITATDLIDSADDDDATTQQPHTEATNRAEATAITIHESKGPITPHSSHSRPPRRSWRSLSVIRRLKQFLSEQEADATAEATNVEPDREDYRRWIRIIYRGEDGDLTAEASALFDTQCPGDWISATFLKANWGLDVSNRPKKIVGNGHNNAPVYSFGCIYVAWSSRDNRRDWVHGNIFLKPKTYYASFEVVDTREFDIIIGQRTIADQKLLVFNRFFGCFKAHRHAAHKIPQTQISDSQARADVRRDDAQIMRLQALVQDQAQANAAVPRPVNTIVGTTTKATNGHRT